MSQTLRALVVVFLLSASLFAATAVVDCDAAQSVNAAINAMDTQGSNTVLVKGTCHESVTVFQRERLSIFGNPSATFAPPAGRSLRIIQSQGIVVDSIILDGGSGIAVNSSTGVSLSNLTIQNSTLNGLTLLEGSRVIASVLSVHNNAFRGIAVNSNSSLQLDTSTIENNVSSAIVVNDARLLFFGGDGTPGTESYVRNNGGGIGGSGPAYVEVDDDVRIQNNGGNGVIAIHNTAIFLSGNVLIEGNGANGVYLGETSHGEIGGVTIRNNGTNAASANGRDGIHVVENSDFYLDGGVTVTGNAGHGVSVDYASLLSSLGGNTISNNGIDGAFIHANGTGHWFVTDSISGNGDAAIVCDSTSLVTGDISGVNSKDVKCSRVERDNGKPRPGNTNNHLIP